MKYLIIFLFSFSACFSEYEIINAEYKDTIDGYKIHFHQRPFKVGDYVVFTSFWKNPDAYGPSTYLFIMKENKINIFEGRKIIKNALEKDSTDILKPLYDVKQDSKNNLWMLANDGRLLKYDWNEFTVIDYIKEKYGKINGNSLEIDENDNIYIHTNKVNLIKYDGNDFIELENDTTDYDKFPYPFGPQNLKLINDNIYFVNINNKIGYYDIIQKKYEKLDLSNILSDNNYFIKSFKKYDNKLFYTLIHNKKLYYFSYDGVKFDNLGNTLKLLPYNFDSTRFTINYCDNGFRYFNIEDSVNFYSLYQIDTNNKVTVIDYRNSKPSFKNRITIDGAYLQPDGNILLPDIADNGFLILKNPSSVETPLNVLFVNNIYPNPAKTNVSIDFVVEPENLPNITVELYNLTGILQSKLDYNVDYNDYNGQGTLNCNIENISNGYYIIVINNGKRKVAKPFIVNKE